MNLLVGFGSLIVIDNLALFFLAIITLVSIPALIYSFDYFKGKFSAVKFTTVQIITLLFIFSMVLLVIVGNALAFLILWELMTLFSYLLVLTDGEKESTVKAASIYIVMTHIGTAFITAAFFLIYRHSGSFDILTMASACQTISPTLRNLIFILFLIGFGTKAGIVPLHIWLPYAHPQAPSHISSLMSGVMIKMAIYGLIRFVFTVLGISSLWWGITIITLAVISCLVGIIYALMENDLKRLLAYSSVENMGIILLGLGLSMVYIHFNLLTLASLAMIASFYHLLNHAAFKGLLFLSAGSVQKGTGTLDIENLGGLAKKMPWTSLFFLIGSIGISALPPLNGFVSEWLLLQAFFGGTLQVHGSIAIIFALSVGGLALTSGLAAACFVKAFGVTFLALPRSLNAEKAKEVPISMLFSTGILSAAVVSLGLFAPKIFNLLGKVSEEIIKIPIKTQGLLNLAVLTSGGMSISIPIIAFILAFIIIAAWGLHKLFRRKKERIGPTWDCGYYGINSRNEYTSTAFSKPFRISFSFFLLPFKKTKQVKNSFYNVESFVYETHTTKVFKKYFYDLSFSYFYQGAKLFKKIQAGSIHLYLSYILITLIFLIILMRLL